MAQFSDKNSGDTRSGLDYLVPLLAGVFVTVGGLTSLVGWVLNIPRLLDLAGVGILIKFNATICVICAGIGLLLTVFYPKQKLAIRLLGTVIFAISFGTLFEHISHFNLGIDELVFKDYPFAKATTVPGRMGIPASLSLSLVALALMYSTYRPNKRKMMSVLGTATVAIASLSLVGYLFGADPLYTLPRLTGIALQTAVMIALLGVGLVAAAPEYGFAAAIRRQDAGGLMIRRLFFPTVLFSLILGWLRVAGQDAGLYDTAFGTAMRTLIEIIFLIGLLWWTANGISHFDASAREAGKTAGDREERLRGVLESLSDAFISLDAEMRFVYVNAAAKKLWARMGVDSEMAAGKYIFDIFPESANSDAGNMMLKAQNDRIVCELEYYYPRFEMWFYSRYFPTSDGGISIFASDITERKQAEATRRESEIMHRLVDAQEADRHRIARDLHDHLGQKLTALRLQLESLKTKGVANEEVLVAEINEIQKYATLIDRDINYLAWELMPTELASLGLTDALRSFVREWSHTYEINAEFHSLGSTIARLDQNLETNLYRVVQEALNNVLKHAGASSVSVLMEHRDDQIILIIEDDGSGFDPEPRENDETRNGGLGLIGMRERAAILGGTLEIETRPGEGTALYIRVPLKFSQIVPVPDEVVFFEEIS